MLQVINNNEGNIWNDIVHSFRCWDIYYLYEYAYSLYLHGDGKPLLIYYENDGERFCCVVMQNDVAECDKFKSFLPPGKFYDWETPYGYGGPLAEGEISEDTQRKFFREIVAYCKKNNVVSQFMRFHPLLRNESILSSIAASKFLHNTIYIDTHDIETIVKNMDSKNRNMVRKAEKNGIQVERREIADYESFVKLYDATMKKNGAADYYFFSDDYFKYLKAMNMNVCIFYAMYQKEAIGGAIFFFNEQYMHYHLAGSNIEYRNMAPNNLLLYKAACWGSERGIPKLHLGGGLSAEDSLYGFKKQFNKHGSLPFYIGRIVFDQDKYNELLNIREENDASFNKDNAFMIQYRG